MIARRRHRRRVPTLDDIRTALWLGRIVARLRTGHVPWRSRTRTRVRRLSRALPSVRH